jgi:hypothetical protein
MTTVIEDHPAVNHAAAAIAVVLDTMLAELPKDAVLKEVATKLIDELNFFHPQLMKPIREGLLARRALLELGMSFDDDAPKK